jgi:hypothetical protein
MIVRSNRETYSMNYNSLVKAALCAALVTTPMAANAGFGLGGLAKGVMGGGSGGGVSSADAGSFLEGALQSTKNVMISAELLSVALSNRAGLAEQKAKIEGITGIQSMKDAEAHRAELESNLKVISDRQDAAGDITAAYQAGNAQQKALIAAALGNLAIGVFRNVQLAGKAPGMVSGVGSNPQLMTRLGEFKTAASLIALQGKSLGTIGTTLPKVMGALKLKMPAQSDTTEPQRMDNLFAK